MLNVILQNGHFNINWFPSDFVCDIDKRKVFLLIELFFLYRTAQEYITLIKNQRKVALEMSFAKLRLWNFLVVAETNRAPTYLRARSILSTLSANHLIPGSFTMQGRCTSVMIGTISVTAAFPPSSRCSEKFPRLSFCGNREVFTIA